MIYLVEQSRLLSTFDITSFEQLEESIYNMAPSMCEYYLNDLTTLSEENSYLNRSNIQQTIYTDMYNIHLDYNFNIYIETLINDNQYETESLW